MNLTCVLLRSDEEGNMLEDHIHHLGFVARSRGFLINKIKHILIFLLSRNFDKL